MNDQRHQRTAADIKLNYAQIGITVIHLKSYTIPTHDNYEVICQSKFWNKREITLAIDVEPKQGQQYAAVLSTYYPNINTSFWLQLFPQQQQLPTVELRTWTRAFQQTIQSIHGEWHQENAGGRRNKSTPLTFFRNPAYLLTLSDASPVRLILHQSFEASVPLAQHHPIGIYVLSTTNNEEPAFVRARSVSRFLRLNAREEYYVLPACFEPNSFAKFEVDVLCDVPFTLDSTERKLPTPSPTENIPFASTATPREPVSTTRKPATTTTTTRRTGTREIPKKANMSLAAARMSTLTDDYSKLK
jgi:hypothetical protein